MRQRATYCGVLCIILMSLCDLASAQNCEAIKARIYNTANGIYGGLLGQNDLNTLYELESQYQRCIQGGGQQQSIGRPRVYADPEWVKQQRSKDEREWREEERKRNQERLEEIKRELEAESGTNKERMAKLEEMQEKIDTDLQNIASGRDEQKARLIGGGNTDIDRFYESIALIKEQEASFAARNTAPKGESSFSKIQRLANGQQPENMGTQKTANLAAQRESTPNRLLIPGPSTSNVNQESFVSAPRASVPSYQPERRNVQVPEVYIEQTQPQLKTRNRNDSTGQEETSFVRKWLGERTGNMQLATYSSELDRPFDREKAARDLSVLELASHAYYDPTTQNANPPTGWKMLEDKIDDETGFRAVTYQRNSDGKVVVSIAGTNKWSVHDWSNDVAAAQGKIPVQFDQARQYIKYMREKHGDAVDCTGHSLGGGACAYAAASLPAGTHATVVNPITPGYLVAKPTSRVDNYIVDGDIARQYYGDHLGNNLMGNVYHVDDSRDVHSSSVIGREKEAIEDHLVERALDDIAKQAGVSR